MATGVILGITALVGAGVSAYSSYAQGQAQSSIANFNAKNQERSSRLALMSAQAQSNTMKQQAEANYRLRAAEAQAHDANAGTLENQALAQDRVARENARRKADDFARAQGEQRAAIGASGVVEASGTPLDLLAETAATIQREQEQSHYANELGRRSIFREAQLERLGGQFALAGATLDRGAGLAEADLRAAAGRAEYLSGMRSADIFRLTGSAARQAGTLGAVSSGISGVSSAYGYYEGKQPLTYKTA